MVTHLTYLAAGQRYTRCRTPDCRADDQVMILAVSRDQCGSAWVIFRGRDGRDHFGLATQFETAVATGEIVPLTSGPVATC